MKSRHILATSVVIMLAATEVATAADKPAKPAAPPKDAPAKTAPAKPTPAAKTEPAKPAPEKPAEGAAPAGIKDPVAVVDGQEIKIADVEAMLQNILAQQHKTAADVPPEQKPMIYRSIVDDMIVEKIIAKRSANEKVTDEDIAKVYDGFKKNFGTEEELKKQIEANGETVDGVKKTIRTRLQAQHWVDAQLVGKIDVADADAEDFYKKNPEQFQMPERVRASHILIKVEPEAKPDEVVAKQKAADAVLARVKKGEDFGKLADELSEDPSAKQNHGDLDFFQKEQMVPEFSDAAFKMKKGEVSPEPVRSQFGYHIIKVTDRKAPETVKLDEVKPKLLAFLKNQKRETEMMKLAKDLRDKADVKINLPELPKEAADGAPDAAAPAKPDAAPPGK